MKNRNALLLLLALLVSSLTFAQINPGETKEGNINLLDAQAQVFGDVFGDSLGIGKVDGYLDFLKKSDLPPSEKKKLAEYYMMYSKTLDEKGKDSLNTAMLKELKASKKDTLN
ncbi:MAG: hypothetical protein HKN52_10815 [Eudoraea sp.]|nr:hypothetical protein [Eudoraea sp.]NNE03644.1 hypothetical protein [Eudoraea sp.]